MSGHIFVDQWRGHDVKQQIIVSLIYEDQALMIEEDTVKDAVETCYYYLLKVKQMITVSGASVLLLCDSWMMDVSLKFLALCLAQPAPIMIKIRGEY